MTGSAELRILFLEDMPADFQLALRELQQDGLVFRHMFTDNRESFLAALTDFQPDLIISDYSLPGFDGMLALELSLKNNPARPFIILTGSLNETTAVECLKSGATNYVLKEHIGHLPRAVREALEQRDIRMAHERAEEELRRSQRMMSEITTVLAARGGDYARNVQEITAASGRLLGADVALYNRLEDGRLLPIGKWRVPADFPAQTVPEGRLCHGVIQGRENRLLLIPDLAATDYATSDPNVTRYGLKSYAGHLVCKPDGTHIGSLCVIYLERHDLGEMERRVLALLAQAIESEEARRASEEALKSSQAMLSSIFRAAPVGIGLMQNRVFLEVNDTVCQITGYSRSELLGQSSRLLYVDDASFETVGKEKYRQIEESGTGTVETRWRRKDGQVRRTLLSACPLDNLDLGQGVTFTAMDITEQRDAEEALLRSEQFMRVVLESSPLGISVRDRDGRLLSHNAAWRSIWAIPDDVIVEDMKRLREDLRLDERDDYSKPWWEQIQKVYREGGRLTIPEVRTLGRRPGSAEWISQYFYAISDAEGRVDRIVVITQDISERKRAEEALRRSEAHYREFFENDLTADYISTPDGRLLDCNPSYVSLFGFASRDEAMACNTTELYPQSMDRQAFLDELSAKGKLDYHEVELRRRDGEAIFAIVNTLGSFDEAGKLQRMMGYLFDITKHKQLQQQFYQAQKMESIGRLAGGVAHDFNNLLTVINGHVELMLGQFLEQDPVREQLSQIGQAGDRAARLTRQLLAFSRRQVLQLEPVLLNSIVLDLKQMLMRLIGEDVELVTKLDPQLSTVLGDVGQLEQVIVNLAVNSRDAMPEGGVLSLRTRNVQVEEAFCHLHPPMTPGNFALLEVEDSGTGMSREIIGRVFEPFFTTKEKGKGTGLGLATVYGIVKQCGGFIWVESVPGTGTAFQIYLPVVSNAPKPVERRGNVGDKLRGSETVLVVEDEEMVRRLATRLLKGHGYDVLEAVNGVEALRVVSTLDRPPHLVLTDVIMPQMGGRELAGRLRQLNPEQRIIFMSGYTEDSIAWQGIQDQGMEFIQKPFDVLVLLQRVRQTLDSGIL